MKVRESRKVNGPAKGAEAHDRQSGKYLRCCQEGGCFRVHGFGRYQQKGQVSSALQRRVEAAIRQLNTVLTPRARSFAKQRTHSIGIIVPDIANPCPFFSLVVRGAEDIAQKARYSTLLCISDNRREKEEHYAELASAKRLEKTINSIITWS